MPPKGKISTAEHSNEGRDVKEGTDFIIEWKSGVVQLISQYQDNLLLGEKLPPKIMVLCNISSGSVADGRNGCKF